MKTALQGALDDHAPISCSHSLKDGAAAGVRMGVSRGPSLRGAAALAPVAQAPPEHTQAAAFCSASRVMHENFKPCEQ